MMQDAAVALPDELVQTCAREWKRLGQPGAWWDGAARLAIAEELRRAKTCPLCDERKRSVSPEMVAERHEARGVLSSPVVDAVHRIASDPGRLTRRWFDRVVGSGLEPAAYVEIVGITMTFTLIETLARAVGCRPPDLPAPEDGDPSRDLPDRAEMFPQAWLPMVPPAGWTGELAERAAQEASPTVPSASWPLSLVPDEHESFFHLGAVTYLRPARPVSAAQAELVAVTVSAANDCFY